MADKRDFKAKRVMPDENEAIKNVKAEPKSVGSSNKFSSYRNRDKAFNDLGLSRPNVKKVSSKRKSSVTQSDHVIRVSKEETKFKHLWKMLIGQNIFPDLEAWTSKKLTKSQEKKIAKWENYFKKIQNMTYYGVMNNEGDRRLRYMEYQRMEWMTPEVGRALDVLASDATIKNEDGDVVKIISDNQDMKDELDHLFFDILDLNAQSFWWVRDLCKFGDSFWTNHVDANDGFKKMLPAPVESCYREVGYDDMNPLAYRFRIDSFGTDNLLPYEVTHFRLRTSTDFGEYGKSILENGRRIWRQLITLEDSMIIYRLIRAPERRIFYFDVGNLSTEEVENAVNRFTATLKKNRIYDENGDIDHREGVLPIHKNSKIPLLDNRVITIEELSKETKEGKENWVYSIDDKTNDLKPGKVVWCDRNYENAEILKVELDDGSYVLTHPTHTFILRDGSSIEARNLEDNMSLMPFYSKSYRGGYEQIYNPATNRYSPTHTFTARDVYKDEFEILDEKFANKKIRANVPIVHHKELKLGSENKLNNIPDNLLPMSWEDHKTFHADHCRKVWHTKESFRKGAETRRIKYYDNPDYVDPRKGVFKHTEESLQKISDGVKHWRIDNPEDYQKMIEKNRQNLITYNKTEENRLNTLFYNKLYNSGKRMGDKYNGSELHKEHNKIRSIKMKEHWKKGGHHVPLVEMTDNLFYKIVDLINQNVIKTQKEAVNYINEHFISYLLELNRDNRKLNNFKKISKIWFKSRIQGRGFKNWDDLKSKVLVNHKVKSVSVWEETADVYCMTVVGPNGEDDRHNFAILPFDMKTTEKVDRYSGIFIKNSVEQDMIIPTRGDKPATKIETLPSQQWSAIEDVEYIHQKFITSLGVPNSFLGYEEAVSSRGSLGAEDIRYSKYVERIQASFLEGLYDIALIHLYIKGYKRFDLKSFEIQLTNPSNINELQELEIIQSRIDVYENAKNSGAYSSQYLYRKILKLSDDEIEQEEKQKIRDAIMNFCIQNANEGTVLFPKDVLDYNKAQNMQLDGVGDEDFDGGGFGGGSPDFGGDEFEAPEEGGEFSNEELDATKDVDLELPDEIELEEEE